MTTDARAIVFEHDGHSYISIVGIDAWRYTNGHNQGIAANGVSNLPTAPGDSALMMLDQAPLVTLQKITAPRRIITKYLLREDLKGSAKDEVISVDQRQALSDADQCLYTAVYEDIPQQAEDIPFVIQRPGGAPSMLPKGVVSIDKTYFARAPSFWHLGPVRASAKYVLWRTAKRLDEVIKDNPLIQWSHSWGRNIDQYLNDFHDTFFIQVSPLKVNGMEVTAKHFKTMFTTDGKDRSLSYATIIGPIDGANLEDLEAKVAAHIEDLVAPSLKWVSPDNCPCCQRRFKLQPKKG